MKKPIDVPTRATVAFVASHLTSGASVLEVGCGEGHVSLELLNRGYHVTGVDSNEDVVARARQRGAPAVRASWPKFESAPVDAIAFTRSLHHLNPLQGAVRKSREVLLPTGWLLVEEFAFDQADRATISWFLRVLGARAGKALITPIPHEFVTDLLGSADPMGTWHKNHEHDLHTMAAMTRAIAEHFIIRETQAVPYLYRYLVPVLPETPEAEMFVEEVLREEARLGERGEVVLIGRRIAATPMPRAPVD